jgi:hypothetical protein
MDLSKVIEQLRRELVDLDTAILSLERLQTQAALCGRPPRARAELRKASALANSGDRRRRVRLSPPGD